MVLLLDAPNSKIRLGVFSLSSATWRLRLLLPFSTLPDMVMLTVEPTDATKDEEVFTHYLTDPSAERISLLYFWNPGLIYYAVVSHHQILHLVPPLTEECKELNWAEWGPTSTRWFHSFDTVNRSVAASYLYLCGGIPEFIKINNICPTPYDAADVLFCDFNPRVIRRNQSSNLPSGIENWNRDDSYSAAVRGGGDPEDASNILAQYTVTDEWVLRSPRFTEDVRSNLPFRVFIRKKVGEWSETPYMVANLMEVFTVSGH